MVDKIPTIEEYRGYTIRVTYPLYLFEVEGPGLDKASYESMGRAKERVDLVISTLARANRRKLELPCVSELGEPCTITGIHVSNGTLLGAPRSTFGSADVYVDTPLIRTELVRYKKLQAETNRLGSWLRQFRLKSSWGSRAELASDYDKKLNALVVEYDHAVALARTAAGRGNATSK